MAPSITATPWLLTPFITRPPSAVLLPRLPPRPRRRPLLGLSRKRLLTLSTSGQHQVCNQLWRTYNNKSGSRDLPRAPVTYVVCAVGIARRPATPPPVGGVRRGSTPPAVSAGAAAPPPSSPAWPEGPRPHPRPSPPGSADVRAGRGLCHTGSGASPFPHPPPLPPPAGGPPRAAGPGRRQRGLRRRPPRPASARPRPPAALCEASKQWAQLPVWRRRLALAGGWGRASGRRGSVACRGGGGEPRGRLLLGLVGPRACEGMGVRGTAPLPLPRGPRRRGRGRARGEARTRVLLRPGRGGGWGTTGAGTWGLWGRMQRLIRARAQLIAQGACRSMCTWGSGAEVGQAGGGGGLVCGAAADAT